MKHLWHLFAAIALATPLLASAQWTRLDGTLAYVSAPSPNNVWGVSSGGTIFRFQNGKWVAVPGTLAYVSSAADGEVWGVTADAKVFRWTGRDWAIQPGRVATVSVGSASQIWAIGTGNMDRQDQSNKLFRWTGSNWAPEAGPNDYGVQYTSVSADPQGNVWITGRRGLGNSNQAHEIWTKPAGGKWQQIAGGLTQVSHAGPYVMGVNGSQIFSWTGSTWKPVPGGLKWLSVASDGNVMGTNDAGMIFTGRAAPMDKPATASTHNLNQLPYNRYLTDGQCLASSNQRFKACLDQGVIYLRQNSERGMLLFASPYGPEKNGSMEVRDQQLTVGADGSVCILNKQGRRWCAVTEAPSGVAPARHLVLGDDGNLCVFPGATWENRSGAGLWCTNINSRNVVEAALRKYPQTPFTDVAAAMAIYDAGYPAWGHIDHSRKSGGRTAAIGSGGDNVSYCLELTNQSTKPLMVASAWREEGDFRMWGVIKPGVTLRFDNRGNSWVQCVNCDSAQSGRVNHLESARWGTELVLKQVGSHDKWPAGGCNDMLGLGPRH